MSTIAIRHVDRDRFTIRVRNHVILIDQPVAYGGDDTAPTPTELFVASLAGCVAFYARRFLSRHGLPTHGLGVVADYATASAPARVARIHVEISVPPGVPAERRRALLAVASHCTVHNTLEARPEVSVELRDGSAAACPPRASTPTHEWAL